MKRCFLLLALVCFSALPIRAQVTVSGNLKDAGVANVTGNNTYVRFTLTGFGGNIPRVAGTNAIAVPYKDFKPDANGNISGTVQGNDTITIGGNSQPGGTWYQVCLFYQGTQFRCAPYTINGGTFNLNSAIPNTTTPTVPAPTGDNTYIRKDGANSPIPGNFTFTGDMLFKSGRPWIDVRAYGAAGDGATNDRAAIQAAIAAIPASGAYLYFPAGTYMTSCQATDSFALNLPSNTALVGAGRGITTIKRLANQQSFCRLINTAVTVSKVQVSHLTLDGNKPNESPASCTDFAGGDCTQQHLVFVNGSTEVAVDDVEFTNAWGDGLYWFGGAVAGGAVRPKVTNSYFKTIFRVGVHAQSFTDGTITGNTFFSSQNNNHVKAELDNTGEGGSGLTISGNIFNGDATSSGVLIGGFSPTCNGTDGAITSGTATFTAASGCFVTVSVGDTITVNGAGAAGGNLTTTISAFTSLTQVTLATNASTTVTNAVWTDTGSTVQNITVAGNTFRGLALGIGLGVHTTGWNISDNLIDNSTQCIATTNYSTLYGFTNHRNIVIGHNTCSGSLQTGTATGAIELDNTSDFKIAPQTITGPWTNALLISQSQRGTVDKITATSSSGVATLFGVNIYRSRSVSVYHTRATALNTTSTMKATQFSDDGTVTSSGLEVLDSKAFGGAVQTNVDITGLTCTTCLVSLALPPALASNAIQNIVTDSATQTLTSKTLTNPVINGVNAQTGTTYTLVAGDEQKLVTFNNAGAVAVTLPQATTTGFGAGTSFHVRNLGAGTVTITPTTSTIDGAASVAYTTGQGADIYSDGTNYFTQKGAAGASGITQSVWGSGGNSGFSPVNGAGLCSTSTVGLGCQVQVFSKVHTIVRLTYRLTTSPAGCTTSAVVGIKDLTSSTVLASLTIANGQSTVFTDSGVLSVATTAGNAIGLGLTTSPAGCTTQPALTDLAVVLE